MMFLAAHPDVQAAPTERIVGGGYQIPAGTSFVVDTHSLNTSGALWGTRGQRYDPSRFFNLKASELRYR
jgi:cytochrome P450